MDFVKELKEKAQNTNLTTALEISEMAFLTKEMELLDTIQMCDKLKEKSKLASEGLLLAGVEVGLNAIQDYCSGKLKIVQKTLKEIKQEINGSN